MPNATTQGFIPTDANRRSIPVMAVALGSSVEASATTSDQAAVAINAAGEVRVARLMALGADIRYVFGGSGVANCATSDGVVPSGQVIETVLTAAQTHMKVKAIAGTGTFRVELLQ